ncbi:MAG: S-methyl-5-thioribose-1-phosphate isomerase [Deltaproteobacteria bacterium]|nr:S-methyl-5-thioribose-1-phosphate isomerase [Deltaproteobacteria bacterium]
MIPTIRWKGRCVYMIDQRKLPHKVQWFVCKTYQDVIKGISHMVIRGAPAIGVAAAMGLALGAESIKTRSYHAFKEAFLAIAEEMLKARPTAVNLKWAVDKMTRRVEEMSTSPVKDIQQALKTESEKILKDDIEINRLIGKNGLKLIPKGASILTHCNAGALATGGYGTALGVIRAAHEAGKKITILADETRPWLQGLRLTSFELMREGIPVYVIADNAAGFFMKGKRVDLVVTGADRIAANGDVANKIGTYQVAVLAKENKIPFYVAAPLSTIDRTIKTGEGIPVEQRDPKEISFIGKKEIGPHGVNALNPAFDITPAKYITAIITEHGVIQKPYGKAIKRLFSLA